MLAMERDDPRHRRIRALCAAVPEGFVTTYGELCPEAPRLAGGVLRRARDRGLPWHRVVRSDGGLAKGASQRRLLEAEGVPFAGERVRMDLAAIPGEALAAELRARGEAGQ